jgi:2-oxoisovalerate dehydrogenase E1 component
MLNRTNVNRHEVVDANFVRFVREWDSRHGFVARSFSRSEPIRPGCRLTCRDALEIFESQIATRRQDLESRAMRARGDGFYTINSAGHEGNAMVGRLTRPTDIALLHYRSGAFMAERARQVPGQDNMRDTMLSFAASALDPISGGRHKVWGSVPLNVPPQTSTIASHLPKALGTALFLRRAIRKGLLRDIPLDSIVVCSFGDASVNHAAAQASFNAAAWTAQFDIPLPLLYVCEDNGIGVSVPTPPDWIENTFSSRFRMPYYCADGLDIGAGYGVVADAVERCRSQRAPVFLHLRVVRLMGHAGTDAEHGYRAWEQIEAIEAEDPLLYTAHLLFSCGILSPQAALDLYEALGARAAECARAAAASPHLSSVAEITAPLAPFHADAVKQAAECPIGKEQRKAVFGSEADLPENGPPRHMSALINFGLHDLLIQYPEAVVFGEDVGKKGGVYNVTAGMEAKFGAGRVFNTLLDETTILGMAIGAGQVGMLPIPEIQYLAYVHNAEDQIRGEACSQQFFSNGQFRNPMVVRIQGWPYQKGFGGHFHNDNSIAALRDIPGLIVAAPSRGDDAVRLLRTLAALAKVDGRVSIHVEPIALYGARDLYEPKDGLWQFPYPAPGEAIGYGEGAIYHEQARDLTILTFANGVPMSLRAARVLERQHGIRARVVDLRWLNPLNEELIARQAEATGRALVVDESRRAGGVAEAILAILMERCGGAVRAARINSVDTYVPLGPAADLVLPSMEGIVQGALALCGSARAAKPGPSKPVKRASRRASGR